MEYFRNTWLPECSYLAHDFMMPPSAPLLDYPRVRGCYCSYSYAIHDRAGKLNSCDVEFGSLRPIVRP